MRTAINQPAVSMQYNFPCHMEKCAKTFLSMEDVTVMEWPAQSPGMNPIENVRKEKNPRNVEKLWTNLKREWQKISVDESNI